MSSDVERGVVRSDGAPGQLHAGDEQEESLSGRVAAYEKRLIEEALEATRGNRARAAKLLQTTERIIGYRVQQYGIDWRAYRE